MIEPDDGWLEQGGVRKPLPPVLVAHERQQYGVYGYLLGLAPSRRVGTTVTASEPGFPPIRTALAEGRVAAADYTVGAPEDGRPLAQHFTFAGVLGRDGVRWFRRMTIEHDGRPTFALSIDTLSVERG